MNFVNQLKSISENRTAAKVDTSHQEAKNCMLPVKALNLARQDVPAHSSNSHDARISLNPFILFAQASKLSDCKKFRIYMNMLANDRQVYLHSCNEHAATDVFGLTLVAPLVARGASRTRP